MKRKNSRRGEKEPGSLEKRKEGSEVKEGLLKRGRKGGKKLRVFQQIRSGKGTGVLLNSEQERKKKSWNGEKRREEEGRNVVAERKEVRKRKL